MHVKSVSIRNYRSLSNVTVKLDGLTTLIGPNGSGKTSVLRALELFSVDAPPVTAGDFNDGGESIVVDLVVSCEGIGEELAPYAVDGEICLRLEYEPPGDGKTRAKTAPKTYVRARLNTDFDKLRAMTTQKQIVPAIKNLKKDAMYVDLPECEPNAKEWRPRFRRYERDFFVKCPGHARSRLDCVELDAGEDIPGRLLDIVYVPAMRDITDDAEGGSGSYLGRLFNMAIDYAREGDTDVGRAANASVAAYREYFEAVRAKLVPRLNDGLSKKSRRFAKDATVTIDIGEPDGRLPPLNPTIAMDEGNRKAGGDRETAGTDIEHVGGGLQRIYLMALLETIAEQGARTAGRAPSSRARLVMIDEPELYQHPQRQRVILRELGRLTGSPAGIQVMCCTHSPYFIELSRITGLRLLTNDGDTSVHVATRQEIMEPILETYNTALADDDALNRWLDTNASHWITEGLFSRLAVLVEGIDDRNVLLATAGVLGIDLNEHEISTIPAHGKRKIGPIAHLFRPFGIPVYLVWDMDYGDDCEEDQRLLGLADPDWLERHGIPKKTTTARMFSCFEANLTAQLRGEIEGSKKALKKAGGWRGLLGGHALKIKKLKHCDSCKCEKIEPTESIKQLLGSRDAVYDILLKMREADEGALDSLAPVKIVRELVRAATAPRPAAGGDPAGGCAGG
ncbi:MAG: ATP-dependent endonuclease [Deltaproteobacteria bacterium]|nr:ATP-dependent endonuclease [Deltaproteobacteria bacterium]